jgi:signal transduction histidine kinase
VWAYPFKEADGTDVVLELGMDITSRRDLELMVAETSGAERRRIGQDLHDTLGQSMTGLGYLIGGLADRIASQWPQERETAEQIVDGINRAIAQMRALAQGLDPVGVEAEGLPAALLELAAAVDKASTMQCEFHCGDQLVLGGAVATHLYRIAQEAINNAIKHSRGRRVEVSLARENSELVLRVADDGIGLPDDVSGASGMGLRVMEYRANVIGARLRVRPRDDGGTVVECSLPAEPMPERGAGERRRSDGRKE